MTSLGGPSRRLWERQIRLVDVGASGQEKLCAATITIGSRGFVGAIERRYALSAGMTEAEATPTVAPSRIDAAVDVTALGLRHAPARELAEGALRALAAIRIALGSS